jgi:hypothetical protein
VALPGFTANHSRYRPQRSYAARPAEASSGGSISPAEFVCDQYTSATVCTCDGLDNCIHMFETGTCSAVAQCDASLGAGHPVCGCIAN